MTIVSPSTTRSILRSHGIQLTKRLGQHFLVDANVLEKELDAAELRPGDRILEIGPGIGTLTEALAARAQRVIAIELDRTFIRILDETLAAFTNVEIVQGDALKMDLRALLGARRFKLVSNLPYHIAAHAIAKVLETCPHVGLMVTMVQKEVADRMLAGPGEKDYGPLALEAAYYADVEEIARVSPHVFLPEPKVESAIVRIRRLSKPRVRMADEEAFFSFVQRLFQQRRKTLHALVKNVNWSHLERERIGPMARAETLSLEQLATLFRVSREQ